MTEKLPPKVLQLIDCPRMSDAAVRMRFGIVR